jgi:hypothetical protein
LTAVNVENVGRWQSWLALSAWSGAVGKGLTGQQIGAIAASADAVPRRGWHPSGYKISIVSSLVVAVFIGLFFIAMAGWSPSGDWIQTADFAVPWILLTYVWIQMGSLIVAGAGTKNQMWIDALTSIVPLFMILYVLLQHYGGYIVVSPFQIRTAWLTAYTLLLDVVIDLGVTILLSRQVVDVGGRGVL